MIPKKSQVQHITADIIVLDQLLARYGPETRPIRDLMRRAVSPLIEHIWRDGDSKTAEDAAISEFGTKLTWRDKSRCPLSEAKRNVNELGGRFRSSVR